MPFTGLVITRDGIVGTQLPVKFRKKKFLLEIGSPAFGGTAEVIQNVADLDDDGSDSLLVFVSTGAPCIIYSVFEQGVRRISGKPDFLARGTLCHENGRVAGYERLIRLYANDIIDVALCDGTVHRLTFCGDGKYSFDLVRTMEQSIAKIRQKRAKRQPVKYGEKLPEALPEQIAA